MQEQIKAIEQRIFIPPIKKPVIPNINDTVHTIIFDLKDASLLDSLMFLFRHLKNQ